MSQFSISCPICFTEMASTGDHQISTLKCGHLFGYACILQWLEKGNACPICRARSQPDHVVTLHWDCKIPIDESLYNSLSTQLEQSLSEKQELAQELEQTKAELLRARDELSDVFLSSEQPRRSQKTIHGLSKARSPAVLFERSVSKGRKLCLFDNILVCCCSWEFMGTSRNGLEIFNLSTMRSDVMQTHDVPIWDIARKPDDNHTAVTVATDKRIIVNDIATKQKVAFCGTDEPLLCCDWVSSSVVVAGGKDSTLYLWDIRAGDSVTKHTLSAHSNLPFRSVAHITGDKVLALTQQEGRCFNIQSQKFDPNYRGTPGGFAVRNCKGTDVTIVAGDEKLIFYKYSHRKEMLIQTTAVNSYGMTRPAIALLDQDMYVAYGAKGNDFSLASTRRIDIDLWSRCKSHFLHTEHSSPIMDLAIAKDGTDITVFALSSDLLRIVSVPNCL